MPYISIENIYPYMPLKIGYVLNDRIVIAYITNAFGKESF